MARQATNKGLKKANKNKKDEFYTQLCDIERELVYYKEHFRGKTIFCNCDDPEYSNFWKYFELNFRHLGLKKLIATHYDDEKTTYKIELSTDIDGDGKITKKDIKKTPLKQNGDFRSPECIEILKEVDIVVTNPPFSLFREYVDQLMKYKKKFLIIGNINCLTYKEIFALIKENKVWLGNGMGRWISGFIVPDRYGLYGTETAVNSDGQKIVSTNNCLWLTNLDHNKRHEDIILYKKYNEEEYPCYENFDAINIDYTKNIPMDYKGIMGVPITFMDKYNPDQFEIIALGIVGSCEFTNNRKMEIIKKGEPTGKYTYNAKGTLYRKYNPNKDKSPSFKDCKTGELYKSIYARYLIKNKRL